MAVGTQPGYVIARDDAGLTKREREVLGGLAQGQTAKQVADGIGVSKQRVDQIVRALEGKGRLKREGHQFTIVVPRQP